MFGGRAWKQSDICGNISQTFSILYYCFSRDSRKRAATIYRMVGCQMERIFKQGIMASLTEFS
jgi:hypothetical protein